MILYHPPPLKSPSQLKFFVQINNQIVAQRVTMPTNDVTMNIKVLIHIFLGLQDHYIQFRPTIALHTDLSHITTKLWEIPVLQMVH